MFEDKAFGVTPFIVLFTTNKAHGFFLWVFEFHLDDLHLFRSIFSVWDI